MPSGPPQFTFARPSQATVTGSDVIFYAIGYIDFKVKHLKGGSNDHFGGHAETQN